MNEEIKNQLENPASEPSQEEPRQEIQNGGTTESQEINPGLENPMEITSSTHAESETGVGDAQDPGIESHLQEESESILAEVAEATAASHPVEEFEASLPVGLENLPAEEKSEPAESPQVAEAPVAEVSEEEEPVKEEPQEDLGAALLEEVLRDEENFQSNMEKASPLEIVLLMGSINNQDKVRQFLGKVKIIKEIMDYRLGGEDNAVDHNLISRYNTELARFNKRRSDYFSKLENEKDENSKKKFELLEELKQIVKEERVTDIVKVREIQNQWKDTGWVRQDDIDGLNSTYKQYLDIFYNLRGKYHDLLDLDRKYNKDAKEKIIAEIDDLIPDEEELDREAWNALTLRVRGLQESWKSTGHVPREEAEVINGNFKEALDRFYEMRSAFYEGRDKERKENGEKKQALLDKLKEYNSYTGEKARDWNKATKDVLALQEEWKLIGPAPKDVNRNLWKEYRAACDAFFDSKGNFFKDFDTVRADNLKLKTTICEQAEALKESDDWKETAEVLKRLQNEWKAIGPVHERYSNKIWKRFRAACDEFFNRRSERSSSEKDGQLTNLEKKEAVLKRLQDMIETGDVSSKVDDYKQLQAEWKEIGFVPFKEKDKVNDAYRKLADIFFGMLREQGAEASKGRTESRINRETDPKKRDQQINSEQFKLKKKIQASQEKIDSYQVNIQLIAKGKSSQGFRDSIQKQIDDEKANVDKWREKLKQLRELEKNPPAAEAPAEETAPVAKTAAPETPEVLEESSPVAEAPAQAEAQAAEPAAEDQEETASES